MTPNTPSRTSRSPRRLSLASALLCAVLGLAVATPARVALADDHADKMLNLLKKRPRNKTAEAWLEERREAARELGRLKDKRAVPILLQIITKERFDVILEIAIDALGEIGDKRAVGPLKKLLNDPSLDAYVKDAVAGALKKLGEEGPKPPVEPPTKGPKNPKKPDENPDEGPETRETPPEPPPERDLATRLARLHQPFGGLPALDLHLAPDLIAKLDRWDFGVGAADLRWEKAADTLSGGVMLASRIRRQVERRALGYTLDGALGFGFRAMDPPRSEASWSLTHTLNFNPELRYYPFQRDLPLLFFQVSGGLGYGLGVASHALGYDKRVSFAGTLSIGGGPGYGRIYDIGARLRLRRLAAVLKRAGVLTGHIDKAVGDQLIAAWYQLRNRVGSFFQLGYTLDILHRGGLLTKETLDPATTYRVIRVLDDPQLEDRPEGMMFRLGYGYGRTLVKDGEGVDLGFLYITGEHAWQIGTTRALESSLKFYYQMLGEPDTYGLTAQIAFSQYLYNTNLEALGALSATLSGGFNNQPGATFDSGGLGWQVMVGGAYTRMFTRATRVAATLQLGITSGSPLILIGLEARYGVAYGAIAPAE